MSVSTAYIPGDRKVECEICRFTWRFSQMRRGVSGSQKGLLVGPDCFDPVHSADIPHKLRKVPPLEKVR